MMKRTFLMILFLCTVATGWVRAQERPAMEVPQLGKSSVEQVIRAMTLEEKARILVGGRYEVTPDGKRGPIVKDDSLGSVGMTPAIPRLGIPCTLLTDGPAGVRLPANHERKRRTYYATAFPTETLIASSWDVAVARKVGMTLGKETLEYNCDLILGPGMNIQRNPLCGRNFEYFSEDPVLTGKMAAAEVVGIQSNGVGASIKHFATNNQETYRTRNNSIVSQRALREIYLKGFEIAVKEGKPWTVMSAYNYLNGTMVQAHHQLLTAVLRNEWGFDGMVETDWIRRGTAAAQAVGGSDLMEPGHEAQVQDILAAVKEGRLSVDIVDRNVRHVLNYILKTPHFRKYKASVHPDLKSHAIIARETASEGIILLKNDGNTLPLSRNKRVALFGQGSYKGFLAQGIGSGAVNMPYVINLCQGLTNAGYQVDEEISELYQDADEDINLSAAYAKRRAAKNDIAILTIKRNAGETADRHDKAGDWTLTAGELNTMRNIAEAFHAQGKKLIVVLNIGGVIETASWKNIPDAILLPWQPSQEGGNAIADVVSGKTCPSGRLPMTFPVAYADIPSSKNFPENDNKGIFDEKKSTVGFTNYEEGIWVGYRYFNTFNKPVSYPFGYGLSYTTFSFSNLKIKKDGKACQVNVNVKNTGNVAGKQVAELYVSAPMGNMEKPARELKAFAKSRLLRPGESQTLTMNFNLMDLASFDEASNSWVVEAGEYEIQMGASVEDIQQKGLLRVGKRMVQRVPNKI